MTNKIIKCLKNVDRVEKDDNGTVHIYINFNKKKTVNSLFGKCPKCGYAIVFDLENYCVECGHKIKSVDTIPTDDMTKT